MSYNDEKKPGKIEYFELREKRLKLVYKVLYAVVAIWVASIICVGGQDMTRKAAPIFAFLLAVSSLITIIMIRYCIMEFRCMRIIGKIDETLMEQTEERYDRIWRSFAPILSVSAFLMFLMVMFPRFMTDSVLLPVFGACTVYFLIVSNVRMYLNGTQKNARINSFFDGVGLYIGIITAYSISAFSCLMMVK